MTRDAFLSSHRVKFLPAIVACALLVCGPGLGATPEETVAVYPTGDPALIDAYGVRMTEDNRRLIEAWSEVNADPAKRVLLLKATNVDGVPTSFVLNEEDPEAYAAWSIRVGAFGTALVDKIIAGETVDGQQSTLEGARVVQPAGAQIAPGLARLRFENIRFKDIGVHRPNNRGGIHTLVYIAPGNVAITFPFELELKNCRFEGTNAPAWMFFFHHGKTLIEDCFIGGTPQLAALVDLPSYTTADRPEPIAGDTHFLSVVDTEIDAGGAPYGIRAFRNLLGWYPTLPSSLEEHEVRVEGCDVANAGIGIEVGNFIYTPWYKNTFDGDVVIEHNRISASDVGIYASHEPADDGADILIKSNTITMVEGSYAALRFGDGSGVWPEKEKVHLASVRNNVFRGGALTGVSLENGSFLNTFVGNNVATFEADASYRCDAATFSNVVVGLTGGTTWVDDQGTDNVFTGPGYQGLGPVAAQQLAAAMSAYPFPATDPIEPEEDSSIEAPLD